MSSTESFDGLCGIIARFSDSDLQLRCEYEFGHSGPCSWDKLRKLSRVGNFIKIQSSCSRYSPEQIAERKFIEAVIFHQK